MAKENNRKKFNSNEDESVFESNEYFVYIAGYTTGSFSYGITWEEAREIAKRDLRFGKDLGLIYSRETENDKDIDFP